MFSKQTPPVIRKVHAALLPLFVSLVVVCYLDRTSLAFAALQLCEEPWFSPQVYGLGSGAFYLGYVTAQVPSNLLLTRFGPRTWLPIITAAWGLVSAACAAMSSPTSFYALRLALGLAEAGAFPGMWYVAGCFYPDAYITLPYSLIEASIALSQILAAPLAAGLLRLGGLGGLAGWRWLFLVQGAATLLLAAVLRARLPDHPATAPFLDEHDRAWLLKQLRPGCVAGAGGRGSTSSSSHATPHAPGQQPCKTEGDKVVLLGPVKSDTAAGHEEEERVCGSVSPDEAGEAVRLLADAGTPWHSDAPRKHHQQQHQSDPEEATSRSSSRWGSSPPGSPGGQGAVSRQLQLGGGVRPVELGVRGQLVAVFGCRWLLYLMALKALKDISLDALVYWVPTLVHALADPSAKVTLAAAPSPPPPPHLTNTTTTSIPPRHCGTPASQLAAVLLSAIPFGSAAAAALALGASSEARGERHRHIGVPLLLGGVAFLALPGALTWVGPVAAFVCVVAAVVAADATTGPFWTWVHLAAPPGTGAVALAAVNSVGKAGGFLGPLSFGVLKGATGSYLPSILLVGAALSGGGALALGYRGPEAAHGQQQQQQQQDSSPGGQGGDTPA